MEDEKATLNCDCNYNLFLAKRLIRDFRRVKERQCAIDWLRYLTGANKTVAEMQLRNEFLHHLVQNLQEGCLRPPFNVPPLTSVPLAAMAHLIPERIDHTTKLDEALSDDERAEDDDLEMPMVMEKSPDGGEFLALQPVPREGSFCYLAITTRKETNYLAINTGTNRKNRNRTK